MKTLGLRHLALHVSEVERSKKFYVDVMRMTVEWEPDPENVYLTSGGQDNLALHQAKKNLSQGTLDHLGFIVPTLQDVDHWFEHVQKFNVKIVHPIKTHRDGAKSFYFKDPDDNTIQIIYHPPISQKYHSL